MSERSKQAVFLSYASQDAAAVRRIADALRAAGIEVWFDQNELTGGDAWDAKIRGQIASCSLFMPVISAATQARLEAYFRIEWKLAAQRTHAMADEKAFLLPVVIDATRDGEARVPAEFKAVQWTRLLGGETPANFCARVQRLLRDEPTVAAVFAATPAGVPKSRGLLRWWWVAPIFGLTMALLLVLKETKRDSAPAQMETKISAAPAISEARQLAFKARAMSMDKYDSSADDYAAAESLIKRALELDAHDAEIWSISSVLNKSFFSRGFDRSVQRIAAARSQAERALKLAPDSIEALYALGYWQRDVDPVAAEKTFTAILARSPDFGGALFGLSTLYDRQNRIADSVAMLEKVAVQPQHAALANYLEFLTYFGRSRFEEAEPPLRRSIAAQTSANSIGAMAMLRLSAQGRADEAAQILASATGEMRNEQRIVWMQAYVQLCQRLPDQALVALDRMQDDFIHDSWFNGPKAYLTGRAHALAGRPAAARVAWEAGLAITRTRLKETPENLELHVVQGELLAFLGQRDEALLEARTADELDRRRYTPWFVSPARIYAVLGMADEALPLLAKYRTPGHGESAYWPLTPALLRLDPLWDKLRDDPRFKSLLEDNTPAAQAAAPSK